MRINFKLNGTDVEISALPNERLSHVLHKEFALSSIKLSCLDGQSGASNILMDDKVVSSSLIPVFKADGKNIISLEYFKTTEDYKIISNAFDQAGVKTCGYCDAGKYFAAYSILNSNMETLHSDMEKCVRRILSATMCRCSSLEELIFAVDKMMKYRRK